MSQWPSTRIAKYTLLPTTCKAALQTVGYRTRGEIPIKGHDRSLVYGRTILAVEDDQLESRGVKDYLFRVLTGARKERRQACDGRTSIQG